VDTLRRFIVQQNVERFRRLLGSNVDSRTRAQLERLLAEAQREFAELHGIWSWTCPHLGVHNLLGVAAENLLDKIVDAHGAEFGSLQVWDEGTRSLRLIAHCNFDRRSAQQFAIVRDGDGTVCEVARVSRAPVFVEDIEKEEMFASLRGWTRAIGIRAIQTTPVFRRSGIFIGAFSTHYASPQTFTSVQKEMNTVYADRIGYLFADLVGI
jgi:GAF domain-containing protein